MPKTLVCLSDLANAIRGEHDAAMAAAGDAIRHAIECGRLLTAAKSQVAHGQWLPWLADQTPVSPRTAQRWMRFAEHSETILNAPCVADLTFADADRLLGRAVEDKPARAENDPEEWVCEDEVEPDPKHPQAPHVANNSGNNEWYTPPAFIEAARSVMGSIDLDPASCAIANETVRANTFFSLDDDGLSKEWHGHVWMNPPYAQPAISDFCAKLAGEITSGRVTQACALTNNATETAWFHDLLSVADRVCFLRGRVKFLDREGRASGAPLQGQAIVYSGINGDVFSEAFSRFGKVLQS